MKNAVKVYLGSAIALVSAGLMLAGCKSAPPLSETQAQTLIQAKYDQAVPTPITITLTDP